MPQDPEELWHTVRALWGFSIPLHQVCPHHDSPFAAFCAAYFATHDIVVWKASRGLGGKSTLLAILSLTEQALLGASVTILGGSKLQSDRVHEAMREAWAHPTAPRAMLNSDPTQKRIELTNHSRAEPLAASSRSVRGPHPERVNLDEIDEMHWDIYEAALGQPMSSPGIPSGVVASSTYHHPRGTMWRVMEEARQRGFPLFEWCISGDALIATPYGDIPMRDIRMGDTVYAHQGSQIISTIVTDHWANGVSDTLLIQTDSGELVCTGDHRILTRHGWVAAKRIKPGSIVYGLHDPARDQRCKAVPVLQRQNRGRSTSSKQWQDVLRMRGAQAVSVEELLALLSAGIVDSERVGAAQTCGCSTKKFAQSQAREQVRRAVPRALESNQSGLRESSSDWQIRGGFFDPIGFVGGGSLWGLLAHQSRKHSERPAQGNLRPVTGLSIPGALGSSTPFMVETIVRSVQSADTVEVYDLSVAKGSSFVAGGIVVHNCYRETMHPDSGWLDPAEVEKARRRLSARRFAVEYDLQAPSDEARAIVPAAVQAMYKEELGVYEGAVDELIIIEPYDANGTYLTGCDWAKDVDYTVMDTIRTDVTPWRRVAWLRTGRKPWPEMIADLDDRMKQYMGVCAHDGEGVGDVVDDFVEERGDYMEAVRLRGKQRQTVFDEYIVAIENGEIESPFIQCAYDEHLDVTNRDLSGNGHPPDSFIAGALAYYARKIDDEEDWW